MGQSISYPQEFPSCKSIVLQLFPSSNFRPLFRPRATHPLFPSSSISLFSLPSIFLPPPFTRFVLGSPLYPLQRDPLSPIFPSSPRGSSSFFNKSKLREASNPFIYSLPTIDAPFANLSFRLHLSFIQHPLSCAPWIILLFQPSSSLPPTLRTRSFVGGCFSSRVFLLFPLFSTVKNFSITRV